MRYLAVLLLLAPWWVSAGPAPPEPVDIREWLVPWENTRPRDPYVGPNELVWFVGQGGDYVANLDPKSGEFTRFELDPGTGPHNLIVDGDGFVWYAGNRQRHIGKLDPRTKKITKYSMPDEAARDPHTLVFDSRGDIWFTVQGGNFVGKLDVASGAVQLIQVPTTRARPYGIALDSHGRPWINLFGTSKLATVDPQWMRLEEIDLPRPSARSRRIAVTPDDAVWYVDYAEGMVGRYEPRTRKFAEWPTPGGADSRPYGMALDDRERVWFVESGAMPNRMVGFDTRTHEVISVTDIPSGGGTVRHMYFHAPTRAIWFGTDTNYIGRALVP